jgi:hypothetical protein
LSSAQKWVDSAKRFLASPDSIYLLGDLDAIDDPTEIACHSLVVTTMDSLGTDSSEPTLLEQIRWWRVFYDGQLNAPQSPRQKLVAVHQWSIGDGKDNSLGYLVDQIETLGPSPMIDFVRRSVLALDGQKFSAQAMYFLRALVLRHTSGQTYRGSPMCIAASSEKV